MSIVYANKSTEKPWVSLDYYLPYKGFSCEKGKASQGHFWEIKKISQGYLWNFQNPYYYYYYY